MGPSGDEAAVGGVPAMTGTQALELYDWMTSVMAATLSRDGDDSVGEDWEWRRGSGEFHAPGSTGVMNRLIAQLLDCLPDAAAPDLADRPWPYLAKGLTAEGTLRLCAWVYETALRSGDAYSWLLAMEKLESMLGVSCRRMAALHAARTEPAVGEATPAASSPTSEPPPAPEEPGADPASGVVVYFGGWREEEPPRDDRPWSDRVILSHPRLHRAIERIVVVGGGAFLVGLPYAFAYGKWNFSLPYVGETLTALAFAGFAAAFLLPKDADGSPLEAPRPRTGPSR